MQNCLFPERDPSDSEVIFSEEGIAVATSTEEKSVLDRLGALWGLEIFA